MWRCWILNLLSYNGFNNTCCSINHKILAPSPSRVLHGSMSTWMINAEGLTESIDQSLFQPGTMSISQSLNRADIIYTSTLIHSEVEKQSETCPSADQYQLRCSLVKCAQTITTVLQVLQELGFVKCRDWYCLLCSKVAHICFVKMQKETKYFCPF